MRNRKGFWRGSAELRSRDKPSRPTGPLKKGVDEDGWPTSHIRFDSAASLGRGRPQRGQQFMKCNVATESRT